MVVVQTTVHSEGKFCVLTFFPPHKHLNTATATNYLLEKQKFTRSSDVAQALCYTLCQPVMGDLWPQQTGAEKRGLLCPFRGEG